MSNGHHTHAFGDSENWVFGYGSLIWRTGFNFEEYQVARIHHRSRRFWQGSTDHRGVPGAPGRVVTLVDSPGSCCWGRAFRLPREESHDILASLDHREKGGYQRLSLTLQFENGRTVTGLTWIATAGNEDFLGPATNRDIANQVRSARGPSGPNTEYVLRLQESLLTDGHPDPHVDAIAGLLRRSPTTG